MINDSGNDRTHFGIINLIGDRTSAKSSIVNRDNRRSAPANFTRGYQPKRVFLAADVIRFLFDKALTWIKVFGAVFQVWLCVGAFDVNRFLSD